MDMDDITALVRAGRLGAATTAIRDRLRGGAAPEPEAPAATPPRDVTPPRARLAPPGAAAPRPAPARPAKARPAAARPAAARPAAARPAPASPGSMEALGGPLSPLLHRAASPAAEAPLIVMLHGCTQTPEDFARGTRMNALADAAGAHVLWPGQPRSANANGCWNWFETAHRGPGGEAGAIAALIGRALAEVGAHPGRVHVAGLSAGGAMAAALAAARPDLVASVGIHSGLGAGTASDMPSAFAAMAGRGPAPVALEVPAIVIHGDADRTVAPANAAAIAAAGRAPGGSRARRRPMREGGRAYARTVLPAMPGAAAVELIEVAGLGHAWSGGASEGSHTDPAGPDASAMMLRFFLANPRPR